MTDRERLIDLFFEANRTYPKVIGFTEYLADYLIAHGVTVLPCKVGDTIFHLYEKQGIVPKKVKRIQIGSYGIMIADGNGAFSVDCIGKTVFLTRDEAEQALNDMQKRETQCNEMKQGDKI